MATRINKEAIDELISKLYQTGFGWEAISSRVQEQYPESRVKTAAGVSTRYYRYLNSLKSDTPITTTDHPEIVYDPDDDTFELPETPQMLPSTATDDYRDVLSRYLGSSLTLEAGNPHKLGNRRKVVACGDMHGNPSMRLLEQIIEEDPDIVINGGDSFNSEAINPHGASRDSKMSTMRDEQSRLVAWYQILFMRTRSYNFVMEGNHDNWARRHAAEVLHPAVLQYFQDPLEVFIAALPSNRVELVKQSFKWTNSYTHEPEEFTQSRYMFMCGDALFSHGNFTDKYSGGAVKKLALWLNDWNEPLGLGFPRCLVQFHTHKMSLSYEKGNHQAWVEPGIAGEVDIESYKVDYQNKWRPGSQGCVVLNQYLEGETWKTDLKSIRLITI